MYKEFKIMITKMLKDSGENGMNSFYQRFRKYREEPEMKNTIN